MWVRVPPSVPFTMKQETKDDVKAGGLGVVLVLRIVWALVGCTWTFHRSPMKLNIPQVPLSENNYRYCVIDESSSIPDAYFGTKIEAENYKEYFKEHHNYKIVLVK